MKFCGANWMALDGEWREERESEMPEAAIGGQLGETFPVSFKMEFGQGKGEEKGREEGRQFQFQRSAAFFSKTAMIPGRTTSNSAAKKSKEGR